MRIIYICILAMAIGCSSKEVVQLPTPTTQDQLVVKLDQIASTGQYESVLTELTMGLEEAGLMGEAAELQQLPAFDDEAKVKQAAKKLTARVKKLLATSNK
ncbi:hypothetical protein FF011L_54910 [Roseimaritima multifibrata]|uniref:Uncharacterized protein n=1 Tax=Roseimaritima multifibrata TaxID=1930274 RepID=A0A517MP74_9BACT|nr:hypothetical protein [Roseimaritima multifibrata]QDS96679.1 hypothetical protein FF011L_54910 [Roseimaritima multifibrata]